MASGRSGVRTRSVTMLFATVMLTLGLVVSPSTSSLGVPRATAAPVRGPDKLIDDYKKLSEVAEKSAEAMHNAQIEYDKQRGIVAASKKASADAGRSLTTTEQSLAVYQHRVDELVRASYKGARVNRLYAILVSDSPQSLLDQMSGLELISRQASRDLRGLREAREKTAAAKTAGDRSAAQAAAAVAAAEKTRSELRAQQAGLQKQAEQIRAAYHSMTGYELAALRGPTFYFDPRWVPRGIAPELRAVQAALSRIGAPYVWGATGPNSFDCSGLMVWAYAQAGKMLPRSSEAQSEAGQPVDRAHLQPGDLIIYYPDAHHVGMYIGNGYVIHASTFGVPVKVAPIDQAGPFNSARRY